VNGQTERRTAARTREGRLAASLAHEINNPLDALLNLIFLMKAEQSLTARAKKYLALAEEEVLRVSQIAHSALEDYHDAPKSPTYTDIPGLVYSIVNFYSSRLETQHITLRTRICGHGELSVYAGPLRQAFSNLVLNAAASMPDGGELHVRVCKVHEWDRQSGQSRFGLRVTIADTGCGIKAENLARIAEPFFTTKGSGGNGLGLSLVKDVVLEHRGSMQVRSSTKAGHSGTVFTVFLPA
jgi:signal transduction histidine kinase